MAAYDNRFRLVLPVHFQAARMAAYTKEIGHEARNFPAACLAAYRFVVLVGGIRSFPAAHLAAYTSRKARDFAPYFPAAHMAAHRL